MLNIVRMDKVRLVCEQQQAVAELAGIVSWTYDIANRQLCWSCGSEKLFGTVVKLPSCMDTFEQLIYPDDVPEFRRALLGAEIRGQSFSMQIRLLTDSGQRVLMNGRLDSSGEVMLGILQDEAMLNLSHSRIYQSGHDELTGLASRKMFSVTLERWAPVALRRKGTTFVMLLQIQRLQHISSVLSTDQVDRLLVRVAGYLDAIVQADGRAARFHGGLFAIWDNLEGHLKADDLHQHLRQRLKSLEGVWEVEGQELLLSFTVGVSFATEQALDEQAMIKEAQFALHAVIPSEQISLALFDAGLAKSPRLRLSLEAELKKAVEQQQFRLLYQPQLDIQSQTIIGAEALLRWQRSDDELITPGVFMHALEESGLIRPLGEWILQEALQQQVAWEKRGFPLQMGINVSPVQLEQGDLLDVLERVISRVGGSRAPVCLEITESLAIKKPLMVAKTLSSVREAGYKIALDDFGIGFSSLEYLLRFSFDVLKIDRAFIWNLAHGSKEKAIVQALTPLCHSLGLKTVAEGVETRQQYDCLKAMGVDQIQGYLLSRPIKPDDLITLIQNFKSL